MRGVIFDYDGGPKAITPMATEGRPILTTLLNQLQLRRVLTTGRNFFVFIGDSAFLFPHLLAVDDVQALGQVGIQEGGSHAAALQVVDGSV